jgi:acetyltransferase
VVFGQGGTAVEVVRDSAIGLPPLNLLLARAQMEETRIWRLLQRYRDKPPAAIDAVADTLIRVGQLAADHPEIRELDINPLLADPDGIIALDTRIRIAPAEGIGAARLAIAPYPKHLETIERLRDRGTVQMRPVRPEDEPAVIELFDHMSPDDLRLRFFAPIRHLSHALAARLTQIDYDREMALLALQNGVAVGIAHFYTDPDRQRAEYAIAVRTDQKGRGIGYLLLTHLIDIARQWGIGELVGEVLRENERMLQMCHTLGFRVTSDPEDGAVLLVHKPLGDLRLK